MCVRFNWARCLTKQRTRGHPTLTLPICQCVGARLICQPYEQCHSPILRLKPEDTSPEVEEAWQVFLLDIPDGSDRLYTAILTQDPLLGANSDPSFLIAVINENTDTFTEEEAFLTTVSGMTDLKQVWFGGKLYANEGYTASMSPVLITRETMGLAGEIIHGNDAKGSGFLRFEPINRINVKNSDAKAYPTADYELYNGTIRRKNETGEPYTLASTMYDINVVSSSVLPEDWYIIKVQDVDC